MSMSPTLLRYVTFEYSTTPRVTSSYRLSMAAFASMSRWKLYPGA